MKTHGMTRTPTYRVWLSMKARCSNPTNTKWKSYGGRGIRVCDRWAVFENFLADMGVRPAGMSIDRVDVNGDYCPENCRWATDKEQQNNRRNNHLISYMGRTMTNSQWAHEVGLKPLTLLKRLTAGWTVSNALSIPLERDRRYILNKHVQYD